MGHFYVLLGLAALAILGFSLSLVRRLGRRHRLPYVTEAALFSSAQRAFLSVLERALGKGYRVYGKVPVADVLGVRPRAERAARRRALARLGGRRFDFLVCSAETSAIACAVNLAPRSRLGRRPSKDGLDRICAAAGLPFVRFREGDRYSVVEVEEEVFGAMHVLRVRPRDTGPSPDETAAALQDLSTTIADQQSPVRPEPGAPAIPMIGGRPALALRTEGKSSPPPPTRRDPVLAPVLADDAVVEDGPSFRIEDGDLGVEGTSTRVGRT